MALTPEEQSYLRAITGYTGEFGDGGYARFAAGLDISPQWTQQKLADYNARVASGTVDPYTQAAVNEKNAYYNPQLALTTEQQNQIARSLGYTGDFGSGGAAQWLRDQGLLQTYQDLLAQAARPIGEGYTQQMADLMARYAPGGGGTQAYSGVPPVTVMPPDFQSILDQIPGILSNLPGSAGGSVGQPGGQSGSWWGSDYGFGPPVPYFDDIGQNGISSGYADYTGIPNWLGELPGMKQNQFQKLYEYSPWGSGPDPRTLLSTAQQNEVARDIGYTGAFGGGQAQQWLIDSGQMSAYDRALQSAAMSNNLAANSNLGLGAYGGSVVPDFQGLLAQRLVNQR